MKLKFLKTIQVGRRIITAGTVKDVDRGPAEIYVAHGDAQLVDPAGNEDMRSTLKRSFPVPGAALPAKAGVPAALPAKAPGGGPPSPVQTK